jgi:hypothetical protein
MYLEKLTSLGVYVKKGCPITDLNRPTGFQEVEGPQII